MPRGKYVVIEGHDGTGKSTQVALLRQKLKEKGINSVEMHEPGGVAFADKLRDVIKDGSLKRDATTNLLLFTAARREVWNQLAKPALARGEWVIAARNWYSTLAYQGYGEGLDLHEIERMTLEFTDNQYLNPDFACILVLDDERERQKRINQRERTESLDTFETKDAIFQEMVNTAYTKIATQRNLAVIHAQQSRAAMSGEIYLALCHQKDLQLQS